MLAFPRVQDTTSHENSGNGVVGATRSFKEGVSPFGARKRLAGRVDPDEEVNNVRKFTAHLDRLHPVDLLNLQSLSHPLLLRKNGSVRQPGEFTVPYRFAPLTRWIHNTIEPIILKLLA